MVPARPPCPLNSVKLENRLFGGGWRRLLLFRAQADDDVDLGDFIAFRRLRQAGDRHIAEGQIGNLRAVFVEEMMMRASIGVEDHRMAFDGKAAHEARIGEALQHIVDRRIGRLHARGASFRQQRFRRDMTIAFGEKQRGERQPLPRRPDAEMVEKGTHIDGARLRPALIRLRLGRLIGKVQHLRFASQNRAAGRSNLPVHICRAWKSSNSAAYRNTEWIPEAASPPAVAPTIEARRSIVNDNVLDLV